MVKIECLVCGKTIEIPDFIDTDNYDGQIACRECTSLLHVKLVGSKVRKYEVVEKGTGSRNVEDLSDNELSAIAEQGKEPAAETIDVESIAKYNPLRDYLASYRDTRLQLSFEQIESIIGRKLETGAYTLKSWWENNSQHAQAISWSEAGWQVYDVDFPQQVVTFKRLS